MYVHNVELAVFLYNTESYAIPYLKTRIKRLQLEFSTNYYDFLLLSYLVLKVRIKINFRLKIKRQLMRQRLSCRNTAKSASLSLYISVQACRRASTQVQSRRTSKFYKTRLTVLKIREVLSQSISVVWANIEYLGRHEAIGLLT